jgi:hypothetical protein
MAGRRWIPRTCAGFLGGWLALLSATAFGQGPDLKDLPPLPSSTPMMGGPSNPVVVQDQPGPVVVQDQPGEVVVQDQPGPVRGLVQHLWGYVDPDNAKIISMHQLACLIDHLDKSLFCRGQVVVKNPDVWGQNRLTEHRVEYENQMQAQLNNFEVVLSSYQRRADLAALTSGTSVGASVGPGASATPIPSAVGLLGPTGLVANANTLIGTMSPLLMPSNLTSVALSNKTAAPGVGLESTVLLDERSDFLNHLHQLRRNNTGDDRSDMPGYGLYLVRTPISILPGAESIKGKGAVVTVQAKHNLTADLLANTVRNVVILDTTYQLMDAVTRGQYLPIGDDQDPHCEKAPYLSSSKFPLPCDPDAIKKLRNESEGGHLQSRVLSIHAGSPSGAAGMAPASEVVAIYGAYNLNKLVCAVQADQQSWFRHDPSVVSWLFSELAAAYDHMRDQARNGNSLFQPAYFESLGNLALSRDYTNLKTQRDQWLQDLAKQRNEGPDKATGKPYRVRPLDVLAFALLIQTVAVDRQLKYDMRVMCQRKGCDVGDPFQYCFFNLWPDPASQHAFNKYVECKWPIHVFSLDPITEQQNQLDLFSQRTELQLALATAVSTGQVSFQNATSYARRLEQDLAAVALNRPAVGFGAGEATFGWRFTPRIQSPPTQSTARRILSTLVNNGPSLDYGLNNLRIEPGQRECYALMVVPNFAPQIKLTTITNWFDLKTHHPVQELSTTDMIGLSRKLQTARNAMQRLCDSGHYRPVDLEILGDRIAQLEAMLPMQSHDVILPFEADLTGSEIFTSFNAALGPRLLTWFGEPGQVGGSILILGSGFSVRDMKVIVGGVQVSDGGGAAGAASPSFDMVSRNVLRVDIPSTATPIRTPVVYNDPSFPCFNQGNGTKDDGTCQDCGLLRGQPRAADVAAKQAEVDVKKAALALAKTKLRAATAPQDVAVANAGVQAAEADVKVAEAAVLKVLAQTPPIECQCKQRWVLDVHVATSNGISNHLFVEVPAPGPATSTTPQTVTTTVTTVVQPNASDNSTTTTTTFQVPTQGSGLPPGTFLPLGTSLPAGGTFVAPGAATINAAPPQSPSPPPATSGSTTKPKSAAEADNAAVSDLNPITDVPPPGAVVQPRLSAYVPAANVNIAAPARGATPLPPGPIFPPRSLELGARTSSLVRAGIAGMPSGSPRQPSVASVRRVDPNVMPTAAQATRRGQGQTLPRGQAARAVPSTTKPITDAPPQPPPRKSLISRVFGGDR